MTTGAPGKAAEETICNPAMPKPSVAPRFIEVAVTVIPPFIGVTPVNWT